MSPGPIETPAELAAACEPKATIAYDLNVAPRACIATRNAVTVQKCPHGYAWQCPRVREIVMPRTVAQELHASSIGEVSALQADNLRLLADLEQAAAKFVKLEAERDEAIDDLEEVEKHERRLMVDLDAALARVQGLEERMKVILEAGPSTALATSIFDRARKAEAERDRLRAVLASPLMKDLEASQELLHEWVEARRSLMEWMTDKSTGPDDAETDRRYARVEAAEKAARAALASPAQERAARPRCPHYWDTQANRCLLPEGHETDHQFPPGAEKLKAEMLAVAAPEPTPAPRPDGFELLREVAWTIQSADPGDTVGSLKVYPKSGGALYLADAAGQALQISDVPAATPAPREPRSAVTYLLECQAANLAALQYAEALADAAGYAVHHDTSPAPFVGWNDLKRALAAYREAVAPAPAPPAPGEERPEPTPPTVHAYWPGKTEEVRSLCGLRRWNAAVNIERGNREQVTCAVCHKWWPAPRPSGEKLDRAAPPAAEPPRPKWCPDPGCYNPDPLPHTCEKKPRGPAPEVWAKGLQACDSHPATAAEPSEPCPKCGTLAERATRVPGWKCPACGCLFRPAAPAAGPLPPGRYHPNPQIDSEVRADAIEAEKIDRAAGLGLDGFGQRTCSECGTGNNDVRTDCRSCGAMLAPHLPGAAPEAGTKGGDRE